MASIKSPAPSAQTSQSDAENASAKKCRVTTDVELLAERLSGNVTYLTPDRQSWIILAKEWMPTTSKEEFEDQWSLHPTDRHQLKLYGKILTENRWSQSWGHSYSYSGSTNMARPIKESPLIQKLIDRANEATSGLFVSPPPGDKTASTAEENGGNNKDGGGEVLSVVAESKPYNGCLQNWYYPEDTIGIHADDEKDLQAQYPIFSLTWGGTRRFLLKPRDKTLQKVELYLEDGDLLLMGGHCQKTHRHEVPKPRKTMDPPTSDRINWTIRAFR